MLCAAEGHCVSCDFYCVLKNDACRFRFLFRAAAGKHTDALHKDYLRLKAVFLRIAPEGFFKLCGSFIALVFNIERVRLAIDYMVGREAVGERGKRLSVTRESDYIVICRVLDNSLALCRIKHTYFGSERLGKGLVEVDLFFARENHNFLFYRIKHFFGDNVDFLRRIGGNEYSVIFKKDYLRYFALRLFIFAQFFAAKRGEDISRLCRRNPHGVRKQLRSNSFAVDGTGNSVDEGGVNVENEFLREKVVQKGFNARSLALLAFFAGIHHH